MKYHFFYIRGLSQTSKDMDNDKLDNDKLPYTVRNHDRYGRISGMPRIFLQYDYCRSYYPVHVVKHANFTTCTGEVIIIHIHFIRVG